MNVQELCKLANQYGEGLRCVIFVQQRLTTHILEYFLNTSESKTLRNLNTASIYATTTPATPGLRVTKSQAAERIEAFACGYVKVLLPTSVAEEGMDVPAANCVVRFDEVQTPVSLVQSRGRARQADSSFVLMTVRYATSHLRHLPLFPQRLYLGFFNAPPPSPQPPGAPCTGPHIFTMKVT